MGRTKPKMSEEYVVGLTDGYTISAQRDILEILIPFFRKHPLQSISKQFNFRLFCQVAKKLKAKAHLTEKGVEQIRNLKGKMNQKDFGLA